MNLRESPEDLTLLGLKLDRRLALALAFGTTALLLDAYNDFIPSATAAGAVRAKALERVGYYLLLPLLLIRWQGDQPQRYGWKVGSFRSGLVWVFGSFLVALPVLLLVASTPSMSSYYSRVDRGPLEVMLVAAADLLGWEFFFRGYLTFTLARLVGTNAILLQAVPFALAHLGKPQLETLTTFFGGAYFGWLSWRTQSFAYAFLLHWLVNVTTILAAMAAAGA